MEESNRSLRGVRFGVFEVDLRSGELRKQGLKIKLQGQPIQILALLLERPGELVTREELREKLWPADTFVDFEHGLNAAIKKLRAALGDSADNPRFVETLHRRGYRFIASVEGLGATIRLPEIVRKPAAPPAAGVHRRNAWVAALTLMALVAMLFGLNVGGWRERLLGGVGPVPIESLAVLPLENLSGDPEQEYFADGMTEALISDLGRIRALRVISRTSVMQYKKVKKPLSEIARELDVDAVIEGSVLRAGKQVRITVKLMRAEPEEQMWSQSYLRDLSEILALQSEVARAIAREIKMALTPEEQTRLAIASSVNPGAHESYLQGRYHLATETNDGVELAIEYFQQALEKDPNYALPYAGLAEAYQIVGSRGLLPRSAAITRAKAAAEKALEMDPALGEAHYSLGFIRYWHWDWSGAERAFKRAIELSPSNVHAYSWYSQYLIFVGRPEESIALSKRLVEIDPLSPATHVSLGNRYVFARRYDRGIEQCRKALELDPNHASAHNCLGRAYLGKEMYEEAIAKMQGAVDLSGGWPKHDLAYAYAMAGKRDDARKILHELIEDSERGVVELSGIARIYAALGETDQAFGWLEKAYEDHEQWLVALKVDPMFDSLRDDPRFQSILRRMNFPE